MYLAPCSVCCSVGIDKQFLAAPVKSAVDKFQLLLEFLKVRGLVKQHLDSFNYFVRTGMKNIMHANKEIRYTVDKNVYLRYKSVRIALRCRLSDITYAAPIYVDIEYVIESNGKKSIATKSDANLDAQLRCWGRTEKVILIQEQLSNNRIIIDTDKKGCVQASVMSSTEARKSTTVIVTEKQKIYLSLNQCEKKVPIMAVMKAMGMESDQEVVQMLGRDPRCGALLFPSIEECARHHVHTQQEALEFLEGKVAKSRFYSASVEKEGRAMVILRDVFVANIPVRENDFRLKCMYVAVMLRHMMEAIINKEAMEDKDYVGNKRLGLSEQLLSLLFEDLVKTLNEEAVKEVDAFLNKSSRSRFDFSTYITRGRITVGLERALSTGNWDVKRFFSFNMKSNIGQTYMSVLVVARLSFIGTLEQLSNNRIIIDTDKKGCVQASVMSSTEARKSKTVIVTEKQKIYMSLNQFEKKGPIMAVMKAMGMESDQEVVQMLGRDPRCGALLFPSIEECASHHVHTQQEALEFLEGKVAKSRFYSASVEKEGRAMVMLRDVFVANIPVRENDFRLKCMYVAVMLRRMMEAIINKEAMDDKDLVKTLNEEAVKEVDAFLNKPSRSRFDFSTYITRGRITVGLERALYTGNWDVKRFRMNRKGMTQFEKSRKVSGPRAVQPSQWGMLCPCDTPEGEACGLIKNLALMTHVTTDQEKGPIISLCSCLGVEDLELLSAEELHAPNSYLIILNGLILGKHRRPKKFAQAMRKL
ncbi:hypothetical protein POM88_016827 [Heracleum sosnowskyi]|uniref:DNA-directed RNA polymerase n=1 Tax=Heracleum sosnowskyi TaxID=360622 RepID=A0AAD8IPB3_9APIA|nr:hypothetical protein POM88_016827 [Heracleum sosnowskyi]